MSRTPTSRDVAKAARVSQATVSYVLAGKGAISPETRARVLRAAEEINYRPNLAARSMRTRRSGRLALVVPILFYNPNRLLASAAEVAEAAGYTLEIHNIPGSGDEQRVRIESLIANGQFEGILVLAQLGASELPQGDATTVTMALSEFDDHLHGVGELADASPIWSFVEHLAGLGFRRFLHVAGDPTFASARARRRTYLEAVEQLGLQSVGVFDGDWSGRSGEAAIHRLPNDTPPLAVIASNDICAAGVIRAAFARGWTVPDQVAVTGWDNVEMSELLRPSLTTVNIDFGELGRRSMTRLLSLLRDEDAPSPNTRLQQIVWRESTAVPAAHNI